MQKVVGGKVSLKAGSSSDSCAGDVFPTATGAGAHQRAALSSWRRLACACPAPAGRRLSAGDKELPCCCFPASSFRVTCSFTPRSAAPCRSADCATHNQLFFLLSLSSHQARVTTNTRAFLYHRITVKRHHLPRLLLRWLLGVVT